jgi:predicted SAM-dependent methyltransferase
MKVVIGTRHWLGEDWVHVDIDSTSLLDELGRQHPVDVVCDARHVDLPDQCAELVTSRECLEHFPWAETRAVVAEWARLVVPGGRLRIEVPDFLAACRQVLEIDTEEMDGAIQQIIFGGQTNSWDFHHAGITPRMLTRWMTDAGLEVTDLRRGPDHGWLLVESWRDPNAETGW